MYSAGIIMSLANLICITDYEVECVANVGGASAVLLPWSEYAWTYMETRRRRWRTAKKSVSHLEEEFRCKADNRYPPRAHGTGG
ncbi:hypothetical protein Trydic_g17009 [Trypoxylus dichotomus]